MDIRYFVMDPTGNRTLLMEQPEDGSSLRASVWNLAAEELMRRLPGVEQAGFFDFHEKDGALPALRMAGGEFCGNAALSAAALYGLLKGRELPYSLLLQVSGASEPVRVRIERAGEGLFTGTVQMPRPQSIARESYAFDGRSYRLVTVRFEGITHLISEEPLPRDTAEAALRSWCREAESAAMGLLLFDREKTELTPLVYVSSAGTLFWESSCASGTAALGAFLAAESGGEISLSVREPAGMLSVSAAPDRPPLLTGSVRLLQQGTLPL